MNKSEYCQKHGHRWDRTGATCARCGATQSYHGEPTQQARDEGECARYGHSWGERGKRGSIAICNRCGAVGRW